MQYDVAARRAGDGIQKLLRRLASLAGGLAVGAAVVGLATFVTGLWVFRGGLGWWALGLPLCAAPTLAALGGWGLVRGAARFAPRLLDEIRSYIRTPSPGAKVLIDHDTRATVSVSAKRFGSLRHELAQRRAELPALWLGVRAITVVPAAAAMAVLGTVLIGLFGTVLLVAGLIR
jgi:hypothetical protein